MKLKLYRSSTVGIDFGNFKILQDPWLTDGEYYGSWSHYPFYDLQNNLDEINSYNAIYISHIHPDHSSEKTLKLLNKNIPIYIHKYSKKFLKFKLENLGFQVYELENGSKIKIGKDVDIRIFAADNCDPELCYRFTGCADFITKEKGSQQIDSISVISNNKFVIVNLNDCPYDLAKNTLTNIKKIYDKVDLLLLGYGGAGPYPQCFDNLSYEQKIIAAETKKKNFLNQAIMYIKDIKPKYFMPFAGTYTLTGKLSHLQDLRGVASIDEAYNYLDNYFNKNKNFTDVKSIKINTDQIFDFSINEQSKPYSIINLSEYKEYIKNILLKKKLDYETDESVSFEEIYELSKKAYVRFLDKQLLNNIDLKTDIYINVKDNHIKLSHSNKKLEVVLRDEIKMGLNCVIYKTDIRLLRSLLSGPKYAHWDNAEIGSHINFSRYPDIYEREVYGNMCYFHA